MTENVAVTLDERARTVRGIKGKQSTPVRSSLSSPYSCKWPELPTGVTPHILAEIKRTFEPLQDVLAKRKSKNRKQTEKKKAEQNGEDTEQELQRKVLRSQLTLGVNEVTRSLERDHLRLVMVCRSAKPDLLTSHLCALSATRQCPAIAVYHLSNTLAPFLNMKTVLAIGFKKPEESVKETAFDELVTSVIHHCPPINIPWLQLKELPPKDVAEILSRKTFKWHKKSQQDAHDGRGPAKGQLHEASPTDTSVSGQRAEGDQHSLAEDSGNVSRQDQRTGGGVEISTPGKTDSEQLHPAKKRKLGDVALSPDAENAGKKRQKIVTVPFVPTTVKPVRIISKELKGKKKKKKGKKK